MQLAQTQQERDHCALLLNLQPLQLLSLHGIHRWLPPLCLWLLCPWLLLLLLLLWLLVYLRLHVLRLGRAYLLFDGENGCVKHRLLVVYCVCGPPPVRSGLVYLQAALEVREALLQTSERMHRAGTTTGHRRATAHTTTTNNTTRHERKDGHGGRERKTEERTAHIRTRRHEPVRPQPAPRRHAHTHSCAG